MSAPKQIGQWSATLGDDPLTVILSRRWNASTVYIATSDGGRVERADAWEASCTMPLDTFAAECPAWILEIEGSRKGAALWGQLCDDLADQLSARKGRRNA